MKRTLVVAWLALGILPGARAGVFDSDALNAVAELKRQVEKQNQDNDARFGKVDESIRNIGVIQLLQQIEVLNTELAKLRGQIEVLGNQSEQMQKRQKEFYLDLDTRLRRVEGTGAQSSDAGSAGAVASTTQLAVSQAAIAAAKPGDELRVYDDASNLFKKGDFTRAAEAFTAYLRDFPAGQLAPNAQYWLGISYFNLRDFKNAQVTEEGLIKRFPDSPKVPDAMLAIASVLHEQSDLGSARNMLEDIIARYPSTDAAGKARTRLTTLKK